MLCMRKRIQGEKEMRFGAKKSGEQGGCGVGGARSPGDKNRRAFNKPYMI